MKTITTEKTVVEIQCYEAIDGKRFATEEACKEYENSLECIVKGRVLNNKLLEATEFDLTDFGSDEYMYYILDTLNTSEQVYDLEMYNKVFRCSHTEPFEIGKKYVLSGFAFDEIDNIYELEYLLGQFATSFRVLAKNGCRAEIVNYLTKMLNEIQNEEIEK